MSLLPKIILGSRRVKVESILGRPYVGGFCSKASKPPAATPPAKAEPAAKPAPAVKAAPPPPPAVKAAPPPPVKAAPPPPPPAVKAAPPPPPAVKAAPPPPPPKPVAAASSFVYNSPATPAAPTEPVGPGAIKTGDYPNTEYYTYNKMSYYDLEVEMGQDRILQPSADNGHL